MQRFYFHTKLLVIAFITNTDFIPKYSVRLSMLKSCGVCIQLLEDTIQNMEIQVPIATMRVAKMRFGVDPSPTKEHDAEEPRIINGILTT